MRKNKTLSIKEAHMNTLARFLGSDKGARERALRSLVLDDLREEPLSRREANRWSWWSEREALGWSSITMARVRERPRRVCFPFRLDHAFWETGSRGRSSWSLDA